MVRVILFLLSFVSGVAAIACALLVPSHLRAVDQDVLIRLGRNSPGVIETGLDLVPQKISSAKLLHKTAEELNLTRMLRFTSGIRAAEETGSAWRNSPFRSVEFQKLLNGPADNEYLNKTSFLEVL